MAMTWSQRSAAEVGKREAGRMLAGWQEDEGRFGDGRQEGLQECLRW